MNHPSLAGGYLLGDGIPIGAYIDLGFGILLLLMILKGFLRGVIREVLGFAGMIAAVVLASVFYKAAYEATLFDFGTRSPLLGHVCWFFGIIFVTTLLVKLVDLTVHLIWFREKGLPLRHRSLGALVGLAKGSVYVGILAFLVASLPPLSLSPLREVKQGTLESRIVALAAENDWILDRIRSTGLVEKARAYALDTGSKALARALLPDVDFAVRDKASQALRPLLEDPELLERLGQSREAREWARRFRADPHFARFLQDSVLVAQLRGKDRVTFSDIRRIAASREVNGMLAERGSLRDLVLQARIDRILEELRAGSG